MVKYVHARRLNLYLKQWGPYIYYFNAKCEGINKYIVQQMNFWSRKYPLLDVLEISYDNIAEIKLEISKIDMNKVFLYHNHEKMIEYNEPNENDIKNIIYQCILLHNRKQERLIQNIGKGKSSKHEKREFKSIAEILKDDYKTKYKYKIIKCIEKIIKLPSTENLKTN